MARMTEIAYHGMIDEATYTRAARNVRAMRKILGLVGSLLLLSIIVALVPLAHGSFDPATIGPVLFFGFMLLFLFWSARRAAKNQLATNKVLQGPIRGVITEETVQIISDYSTANLPWSVFHFADVRPDLVLLYASISHAHIFPRSFFGSDSEWSTFCGWVATKVPKKPKGSSTFRTVILWAIIVVAVFLLKALFETGR